MAKLTTKQRKKLAASKFAEPKLRKFPVNDKSHAANAKARASQMANEGKISESTKAKVDSKANKVLAKKRTPAKAARVKKY